MGWLKKLLRGKDKNRISSNEEDSLSFIVRNGETVQTDEAYEAWTTGNFGKMIQALGTDTHPLDRHFLLMEIVEETYRRRKDDQECLILCEEVAYQHIKELPALSQHLIEQDKDYGGEGDLPQISTFKILATILTEKGDFDGAVEVCKRAIELGLSDGTKGGFDARIERIRKLGGE